MVIVIGEILIDCFPDYQRIGGAPFNFAFHLKQLGIPVRLITRVGKDSNGEKIRQRLIESGFSPEDLQVDLHHETGRVEISLDDQGVATFDILPNMAYDHLRLDHLPDSPDWRETRLIYFGSLVQRTPFVANQLASILAQRSPNARCFCDINLRPPHHRPALVEACLAEADILKLNDDECRQITGQTGAPQSNLVDGIRWLMDRYRIELVAVTKGANGSFIVTSEEVIEVPKPPPVGIMDTVGAGDGYSAILALGLLRGEPLAEAAAAASGFAARICTLPGAVPETNLFYSEKPLFQKKK